MKKLLFLVLFLIGARLQAQVAVSWDEISNYWVELDGGDPVAMGTVTSVGLAAPVEFTLSGSPVTSAGTLTLSWASQAANLFLASPDNASGILSMRALTTRDMAVGTAGQVLSILNATTGTFDWIDAAGGGSPTDADYLVGTANGSLSAEIVVGTSPGGELGGTWASPTVDDSVAVSSWTLTSSSFTTSFSETSDPADAGAIRLNNASNLAWEASPAGTDVTLGVDSSEILQASGTFNAATLTEGGTAVPNTGDNLSVFAATTSAQLAGVLSDETGGTGVAVFGTSPTITTSLLQDGDVADAGYLRLQNAAIVGWEAAPTGTDVTLTVDSSEVMQASGTFNAATLTEGGTGVPNTGDKLSVFAATSSSELFGVLSDETGGTGVSVGSISPALVTPSVGNGATGPGSVLFKEDSDNGSNAVTLIGPASTADVTATLPAVTGTVLLTTTNKLTKSITVENPGAAEKIPMFSTTEAATILDVCATLIGSSTPSVTYNVKYGSDLSAAGTSVTTTPSATTSVTTADCSAALNNTAPAASDHVWFITTAQSGTVTAINVTITYSIP